MNRRRSAVAGVDRLWGRETVVTSVGPLAVPPAADLAAALVQLAEHEQITRLGWDLSPDGHSWQKAETIEAFCRAAVLELATDSTEDQAATALRVMARGRDGLPIAFVRVGDSLTMNVAHGLGDGYYMSHLLPAVVETAMSGVVPDWCRQDVVRNPLRSALWSVFGRHPSRVKAVLAGLGHRDVDSADRRLLDHQKRPWEPSVSCTFRTSSVEALAELKRWRKRHAAGMSTVPVTLAAAEIAHRRVGVGGGQPLVLFDARRYVPRELGIVAGNFCVGLRLDITDPGDPLSFDTSMKQSIEAGRPLTALSAAILRTRRGRPVTPASVAVGVGWDVAYSHMGRPTDVAHLPWLPDAGLPYYMGVLTPGSPSGISYAFTEIGGRMNVSATFHDNVIDPADVSVALELLCGDPVELLESHRLGQNKLARL